MPCSIGKNYLEHAKELGDAVPDRPVLFMKPPSAAVLAAQQSQASVRLPQNRCCQMRGSMQTAVDPRTKATRAWHSCVP